MQADVLLERVFQRMITANKDNSNDHMNFDTWEWPVGVALYGLFKYNRINKQDHHLTFMTDWFDRHLDKGLPSKNVNTVAPLLTLAHLYELKHRESYLQVCLEWTEWIMKEMPRTEEGGLQHMTILDANDRQLWDDTLFMTVLFLAKMAQITGRQDLQEEAEYQFLLHIKYLYDTQTGLWYHGWNFIGRHAYSKSLWARGNCWFTASVVEFIEISGVQGSVKRYLLETLQAQVEKLQELQEPDGMWHTLLTDRSSYVEASATAGFGFGILKGIRLGYLPARYAEAGRQALQAVVDRIGEDGTVADVSYGTAIGHSNDHYKAIPVCPTAYGQALTIMLLTEALKR
ncbi:glycoside hydrolase family 88 protein [Paenibacillus sp. WST5]|uniref:Glycoside hydrolase family 88 protein n=1 Tax=Paenibacillus sedimenti TaxID=2770274 RepID=A0A926KN08_9BACL|nr:glycoside hydrolase family 88 protein [Paenibacillus sedimenti]